jgi:hypothetical protein
MSRHERRKAQVLRRKAEVLELKTIPASEIGRRVACAWKGCGAGCEFDDSGDFPPGWATLLLAKSYRVYANILEIPPELCLRDAVLCPEHTRQLDSLLVDLGRELLGPAAGAA